MSLSSKSYVDWLKSPHVACGLLQITVTQIKKVGYAAIQATFEIGMKLGQLPYRYTFLLMDCIPLICVQTIQPQLSCSAQLRPLRAHSPSQLVRLHRWTQNFQTWLRWTQWAGRLSTSQLVLCLTVMWQAFALAATTLFLLELISFVFT